MNVTAEIYLTPIGTPTPSLSEYIAAAEAVLKRYPNLQSQLNPMSTTISGDLETLLQAVREMHEAPFAKGAQRVSTTIRIDDRRDGRGGTAMEDRVKSVQSKMNTSP